MPFFSTDKDRNPTKKSFRRNWKEITESKKCRFPDIPLNGVEGTKYQIKNHCQSKAKQSRGAHTHCKLKTKRNCSTLIPKKFQEMTGYKCRSFFQKN